MSMHPKLEWDLKLAVLRCCLSSALERRLKWFYKVVGTECISMYSFGGVIFHDGVSPLANTEHQYLRYTLF